MTKPRVLLTNDDGYDRSGLTLLREALRRSGFSVTVLAPTANRSGIGRAATIHGTVSVVETADGDPDEPIFACEGTPVDCVRIGLLSEAFAPPDLVVSGINHGTNLGDDLTFSGTVGAALEAVMLGVPALAFSQQSISGDAPLIESAPHEFGFVDDAARCARAVLETPGPRRVALNVNFPTPGRADGVRFALTKPAERIYFRGWMQPTSQKPLRFPPYGSVDFPDPGHARESGTDVEAVLLGQTSITPLNLDWSRGNAAAIRWAEEVLAYVTRAGAEVESGAAPAAPDTSAGANGSGSHKERLA